MVIAAITRWVLAFALVLCIPLPLSAQAGDAPRLGAVRVGVFTLFHPDVIIVTPMRGRALRLSTGQLEREPVRLQGEDGGIRCGLQTVSSIAIDGERGGPADFTLAIPGKIERRFHGKLEVTVRNSHLVSVVRMDLETAVASVVAAESLPGTPIEALKAQAIAARSYLVAGGGRHGKVFDFCDATHCQFLREAPGEKTPAFLATQQTRGTVLVYDDHVFAAMYSKSCGGQTHSLAQLGMHVRDYPYYPVQCVYCRRHPETWVVRVSGDSEKDLAARHTEQARLQLARSLGWSAVPGNSYTVRDSGKDLVLSGAGVGHGLGLCQRGAAAMARADAGFEEILLHYYPNTTLKQLR